MAIFDVIPYLGPPAKHSQTFKKPKPTVEQAISPLQSTDHQECPGNDLHRSQLVCAYRSSMEPTKPLESPARLGLKHKSMICQVPSPSPIQDRTLSQEITAQFDPKTDFDSADWVCSSRSSTYSAEASPQPVEQAEDHPQGSEILWQRQLVGSASDEYKQSHKRKASIAGLIPGRGDQVDLCSIKPDVDLTLSPQSLKKHPRCKKNLGGKWTFRQQKKSHSQKRGELALSFKGSSDASVDSCVSKFSSKSGGSPDQPILIQDGADDAYSALDPGDEWVVKHIKGHRSTTFGLEFKVAWEDTWVREEDLGTVWELLRQYKGRPKSSKKSRG